MNSVMNLTNNKQQPLLHAQWLDKLWQCIFGGHSGGLMSPGQIRRENRDRDRVRQIEMAAILEAEEELNSIHQGHKMLDEGGNLIDTPPVEAIATHNIIENTAVEQHLDISLDSPATMIRSVVKELSIRNIERSLNLRKIAIQAESDILASAPRPVSPQAVNAEWLVRWRESAQTVLNPELQPLWAKTIIQEVASPGSFSLGLMSALLQMSPEDWEVLRIAAKYAFSQFIVDASDSYFNTEAHQAMFDVLEDLALMVPYPTNRALQSTDPNSYVHILQCGDKALKVTHRDSQRVLQLPMYKLTRIGRQLFSLCKSEADTAYLFSVARQIKDLGFHVALGECRREGSRTDFIEKLAL